MLGVDEGGDAAPLLGLGYDVEGQGGLAARLRPEYLHYATPRETSHADGRIEGYRARRNRGHVHDLLVPEAHHRALAELFLYLGEGQLEGLLLACRFGCHGAALPP